MTTILDLHARRHDSRVLTAWLATRPGAADRVQSNVHTVAALERGDGPITHQQLAAALGGLPSSAGVVVNETVARSVSAVWACVDRIAGAIASMPLPVYERTGDGRSRVDHDVWWLLNEEPWDNVSAATWLEYLVGCLLLGGDAFAEILRPGFRSARITGFRPHHWKDVSVGFDPDGLLMYDVHDNITGEMRRVPAADMIHVPGLFFDGKRGLSVLRAAARDAVGISSAAADFSGRFFANGAAPSVVLKTAKGLEPGQADALRTSFEARFTGQGNMHRPIVLAGGMELEKLSITPEDASLLDTRRFQVEEIARIFGVPPHMIGHTSASTSWGTGIEQQSIGFVKYTLQRHLVKIEQELNRKIWPTRARYYVEFSAVGLERGDTKTRNEAYRIALGRAGEPGWMSVNEVRRAENLPPVEGGDIMGAPNAQTPAAAG
jgi:HK97 family phage portal protein